MATPESIKAKHDWRWALLNSALIPFGRSVVRLGAWPDRRIVATAGEVIRSAGGTVYRESGSPCGEIENVYFRLRGRRLRLCIVEYGAITLWGPRSLVRELTKTISDKAAVVQSTQ